MTLRHHRWQLGDCELHIVDRDIFSLGTEAIVNSDQTDFRLSPNLETISGQILARGGGSIQEQLLERTEGHVLTPPEVLVTHGHPVSDVIYHAGFHRPDEWMETTSEEEQAEHLKPIRRCVEQILASMANDGVSSIAFPTVGCGVFGLSRPLFVHIFVREVIDAASRGLLLPSSRIFLSVYRETNFEACVDAGAQALIDMAIPQQRLEPLDLGIDFIDECQKLWFTRASGPWLSWRVVRLAELLTAFMFSYVNAHLEDGRLDPADLVEEGRFLSFGATREALRRASLAAKDSPRGDPWMEHFCEIGMKSQSKLELLNQERNQIAHGKKPRSTPEIYQTLRSAIACDGWIGLIREFGQPGLDGLEPWVRLLDSGHRGVLEQWKEKWFIYILPALETSTKVSRSLRVN